MIEDLLPAAILGPDTKQGVYTGTISQIYADGTVDVDLGSNAIATGCYVVASYTPVTGDLVELVRRDSSSWLVYGPRRTSNATTVQVGRSVGIPWNINPAAPGVSNPLVKNPVSTRSWRESDGWGGAYLPAVDYVGQGAYSSGSLGYYRGCYFYGAGAFTVLAGRRCTSLTIRLSRAGSGGASGGTTQWIAPHVHATQPAGQPTFVGGVSGVGTLAWNTAGVFNLPIEWGQGLIDGIYSGFGHLLLAYGNFNYSIAKGLSGDASTGQISLGWT